MLKSMKKSSSPDPENDYVSKYLKGNKIIGKASPILGASGKDTVAIKITGSGPTAGQSVVIKKDSDEAEVEEGGLKKKMTLAELAEQQKQQKIAWAKRMQSPEMQQKVPPPATPMSEERVGKLSDYLKKKNNK
jgi:hypothetical protein